LPPAYNSERRGERREARGERREVFHRKFKKCAFIIDYGFLKIVD
jgi:hypothetical protein